MKRERISCMLSRIYLKLSEWGTAEAGDCQSAVPLFTYHTVFPAANSAGGLSFWKTEIMRS